ncbi:cation diffusion facilitator family transporter [Helicobacter sp. MIT 14-3879]|uniref:cation diffusion facilitator family transporter n=1 Tax=Helicobacter sp. MIT 14-3879 TaxID=2040649 RepID=UPI000E1E6B62|nr:cation diffusion facilitator family transporter [Helicobacter sp. MIT 14-3879]RDU62654.1 cation transporter [Helicobacter sp. MIT 14-3879]
MQKNAILIVSFIAFCLTILKLIFAVISGSVVILASAIDSLLDVFVSLFNHFTLIKSHSPSNKYFNYGFGKLEGVASVLESLIIFCSGTYIIYESIVKIISNKGVNNIEQGLLVMIISIIVTFALVCFLKLIAKSNNSIIIKSEVLHYKSDLLSNAAVIVSLIIIQFTSFYAIDSIIGGILGIYICIQAYKIAKEGFFMLLDRAISEELNNEIIKILDDNKSITSYHELKSRVSGDTIFLEYHLVFDNNISLFNAHSISNEIEYNIECISDKYKWVILTHLDPYDDSN